MKSVRKQVVEIIDRFYNTTLDLKTIQNNYFKQNVTESSEQKRIVILSKDILRWKGRIDYFINIALSSPFNNLQSRLLAILELATFELIFDKKVPNYAAINSAVDLSKIIFNKKTSGLVNAVLRKISRSNVIAKPDQIKDFEWYSFPEWLYNKWLKQFGESRTQQLCEYHNSPVALTIRRNIINIDHKIFIEKIEDEDIEILQVENSTKFYNVKSGGMQLLKHQLFVDGNISFQDRGAGAIVEVLDPQPNEIILDVCCAPGTKTNYISELMRNTGVVYASDFDRDRLEIAKNEDIRLKNTNIFWEQKDAKNDMFPMADRILVDAPCTGTGVIGRRPDIKWRRKPRHLSKIVELQKSILVHICKFVKDGGILVYATCSLEDEENWKVVEAFLKLHNDFKVTSIRNTELENLIDEKGALKTFPSTHKIDGMFAVKMIRER